MTVGSYPECESREIGNTEEREGAQRTEWEGLTHNSSHGEDNETKAEAMFEDILKIREFSRTAERHQSTDSESHKITNWTKRKESHAQTCYKNRMSYKDLKVARGKYSPPVDLNNCKPHSFQGPTRASRTTLLMWKPGIRGPPSLNTVTAPHWWPPETFRHLRKPHEQTP